VVVQVTEAGQWKRQNALTVFVDGVRVGTHDLVEGAQEVQVATGLADGPHDVLIAKSTEAMRGMITLDGVRLVDARPLGPPSARAIGLQFIGDSITCAGGNIGPSENGCDATDYEDGGQGFPLLTAATLDAELDVVCQSGIALWRNASPILDYYEAQVLPFVDGEAAATPRAASHVVINLGTNDLSGGDPPEAEYKAALHALLDAVRADSPTATLLLVVGPIVAGPSADLLEGWYADVAAERADPLIRTLRLAGQNEAPGQVACSHPNAALHADIAALLVDELAR
jgi:lysophospholipase L1-like esterase